jgi:hypothetical protein
MAALYLTGRGNPAKFVMLLSYNSSIQFFITEKIPLGMLTGCVHMKYLSPAEGIAVNVSYGNRLLHTEVVKGK